MLKLADEPKRRSGAGGCRQEKGCGLKAKVSSNEAAHSRA
jgi:hypothetical protein